MGWLLALQYRIPLGNYLARLFKETVPVARNPAGSSWFSFPLFWEAVAFVIIILATVSLAGWVGRLGSRLAGLFFLGPVDKLLGFLLGALRGGVGAVILVWLVLSLQKALHILALERALESSRLVPLLLPWVGFLEKVGRLVGV